jgi:hypothetical protein
MVSQREQQLISDALNQAHLTELPDAWDKKTVWIEGVAKIRLANNSIGYGIVKHYDLDAEPVVSYINGDTFSIVDIEEVYPYVVLQKEYIKKFTAKEKEKERIAYLQSLHLPQNEQKDFESMTLEELNKEIVNAALYLQLKDTQK